MGGASAGSPRLAWLGAGREWLGAGGDSLQEGFSRSATTRKVGTLRQLATLLAGRAVTSIALCTVAHLLVLLRAAPREPVLSPSS